MIRNISAPMFTARDLVDFVGLPIRLFRIPYIDTESVQMTFANIHIPTTKAELAFLKHQEHFQVLNSPFEYKHKLQSGLKFLHSAVSSFHPCISKGSPARRNFFHSPGSTTHQYIREDMCTLLDSVAFAQVLEPSYRSYHICTLRQIFAKRGLDH